MTAAGRFIWEAAGYPEPAAASVARLVEDAPAQCAVCGQDAARTATADKALGTNFVDRGMFATSSPRVCAGCLWACSGKPPATLRMWSIVCAPGHDLPPSSPKAWLQNPALHLQSRAGAPFFGEYLAKPSEGPWVLSIALSGQKHVVPYAQVNHGRGPWSVRVEDHNVTSDPVEFARIRTHALALRAMGIPEACVLDGTPAGIKTADQLDRWARHDAHLSAHRESPLLRLALWTITKEAITHAHP